MMPVSGVKLQDVDAARVVCRHDHPTSVPEKAI